MIHRFLLPVLLAASTLGLDSQTLQAQEDGIATQTLVHADSKADLIPTIETTTLDLNKKTIHISSLTPVTPSATQVALLIDDGLRRSAGTQLSDIRDFVNALPAGTEVLVGYMTNGRVVVASPFTSDHAAAAAAVRIPIGLAGISASPYFCLSEFARHWPGNDEREEAGPNSGSKARFIMMITNGVDPYNGSVSISNQDSPYVAAAIADSQRAGIAVSSIFYGDAGMYGGAVNFSGQSYLQQLSAATGGEAFYEGSGNPVSFAPYFRRFRHTMAETYIASFPAGTAAQGREQLLRLKVNTSIPKLKLRAADAVRPGNHEASLTQQ